jgi:hypothetical protein
MPNLYPGMKPPVRSGRRLLCLWVVLSYPFLTFAQPVITSFSPMSGPVGSTVTITGSNFNPLASSDIVWFGSVKAPVSAATTTTLTVTVPTGSSYQPIMVTTGGLTAYSAQPFIITFPDPGQFVPSAFSNRTDLITGSGPLSVFSMDIDGDGKPDLVVADGDSNRVEVYLNTSTTGSASFSRQYDYLLPPGYYPIAVTAGDLDGDGKPEIVVCNYGSPQLAVFLNTSTTGSISFAAPVYYALGNYTTSVVIQDCNEDGKPEIVVASLADNVVSLYGNNSTIGNLSFSPRINLSLPSGYLPTAVIVSDLDGDGKPDLACADNAVNIVSVFLNTGTPGGTLSFSSNTDFPVGNAPQDLVVGDMDGDGKPDLAVINNSDNTISLLRNTSIVGTPSFSIGAAVPTGNGPYALVMADFDGDGKPDLASVNSNDNTVSVHRNTSSVGSISIAANVDYNVGDVPWDIATADFDGDGIPDLVTCNNTVATLSVLLNSLSSGPVQIPTITSFTPISGTTGTTVTINGTNLTGVTAVSFGGVAASSFQVLSDTVITAVVGFGSSGSVSVTAPGGVGTLAGFTYVPSGPPPALALLSFTPTTGTQGTNVIIKGQGLSTTEVVTFGGVPAGNIIILSDTIIVATVNTGATGEVSVTTTNGSDSLPGFIYVPPTPPPPPANVVLNSFTPASGQTGTTITISGVHLTGATGVSFGDVRALTFTVVSDTQIIAVVGAGATGYVAVANPSSVDSLPGFTFLSDTTPVAPPPPVFQLIGFSGGLVNDVPQLQWNVVNDAGIAFYAVERGIDSTQFAVITTVSSVGAGATGHTYTYSDPDPSSGTNYYRLKMEDTSEAYSYSSTIAIQPDVQAMAVYPNPVKYGFFLVDLPYTAKASVFRLTDMGGKTLLNAPEPAGLPQVRINVPALPAGAYRLSWTDGTHTAYENILVLKP